MIELDFKKMDGLIPAVAVDYKTGEVLMVAFMNKEAWENTLATGKMTYYSRTRNKQWVKGESSGNVQLVKEIFVGCELDSVLCKVEQVGGAACHEGYKSCYFRKLENGELKVIAPRIFDPEKVYKQIKVKPNASSKGEIKEKKEERK
jgi:phosphoribosyl-AMP cyclohydrolase